MTARLPDKDVGPLPLRLRRSGDGHYTGDAIQLLPAGDWTLEIRPRVGL